MKKELEIYELVLLIKFTLSEQDITSKLEYYKDILVTKGSQVMIKNCGKKSLAYPIKGFDTAISLQLVYLGNGDLIKLLNTEIKRDESILRAITTKVINKTVSKEYVSLLQ